MSAELRLLDDDFDIEKYTIEECEKALESLTKEMIKSRIVTMPKIYVVSSVPLNRESLFHGFIKTNPILPNQSSYCVVAYFEPHYKILKRRKTMKMRKRRNRAWQSVAENL